MVFPKISEHKEPEKANDNSDELVTTIPDDEATRNHKRPNHYLHMTTTKFQGIRHQKRLRYFIVGKETKAPFKETKASL